MTSIINSLIDEKEDEIRQRKEESERAYKEAVEKFLTEMKVYLGDFYTFLEERHARTGEQYNYKIETGNGGRPIRIYYNIPAMPEEELAPIVVKWGEYSLSASYRDYQERFNVEREYFSDLKEALRAARIEYPNYVKRMRAEALKSFRDAIPHSAHLDIPDPDFEKLIETHLAEWPDLEGEAREIIGNWKSNRANEKKYREDLRIAQEAEAKKRADLEALRVEYVSRLAEYLKESDEVRENNRVVAEKMQAIADRRPYTVYKLEYAIVADYIEDGERYREIELRSVWTLYAMPDSFGFWDIDGKKIEIFHPVTLEMQAVKASSGILAKKESFWGADVYFSPESRRLADLQEGDLSEDERELFSLLEDLAPLPEAPEVPSELNLRYSSYELERQARRLANTGTEDESDF